MMNHITNFSCLMAALLIVCDGSGQIDVLPVSSAQWQISYYDGPDLMFDELFYLDADNDTLIDGSTYHKLTGYYPGAGIFFAGAYRSDGNGKLYFRTTFDQTVLLYDLDVQVGDTLDVINVSIGSPVLDSISMRVETVDTVLLASRERKRIGVQQVWPGMGPLGNPIHYWIEGIGGTGGLLTTCGCATLSGSSELRCMSANDTIQYHYFSGAVTSGMPGDCFPVQGMTENGPDHALRVFPNPSHGPFTIEQVPRGEMIVLAPLGVVVAHTHANELDLTGHPPGVYTAVVTTGYGRQVVRLVLVP
ncbi:MAG: T9SS type A sorting domain-containing protein [Flavobacteriales bacterium]|nr:T9SS type A sorting domain-containing protein [Flavobacteriales bacterium]